MSQFKSISITSEPESLNVSIGSNVIFKVSVSGVRLTFQWYSQDGMAIPGATKPFLTLGPLKRSDFGFYRVRIQDYYGEHVLSRWTELANIDSLQHSPPAFAIEPKSVCGRLGSCEYLFAFATGVNMRYQWYNERGTPVDGATDKSLVFAPINQSDFSYYRCLAVDEFGRQILSNWVELAEKSIFFKDIC